MKLIYKHRRANIENRRLANELKEKRRKKRQSRTHNKQKKEAIEPKYDSEGRFILEAPYSLDLYKKDNRSATIHYINKIRNYCSNTEGKIHLKFTHTGVSSAAAVLLLCSVVDESLIKYGRDIITMSYPRKNKIEQILQQVGLTKRLGRSERISETQLDSDVGYWKYSNGHIFKGVQLDKFIGSVLSEAGKKTRQLYYKGLKEAISNCVEHAYIDTAGNMVQTDHSKWWIFGGIKDGRVIFVVCDLGVGIPQSLKARFTDQELRGILQTVKNVVSLSRDQDSIHIATKLGESRIGKAKGRGRGLNQLLNYIKENQRSVLSIYSNRGSAKYRNHKDKPHKSSLPGSIRGTIVEWQAPIA